MVKPNPRSTDRVFRALADSTRRKILFLVARSDCTVAELAQPFDISAPAVSRHLRILEEAGLLQRHRAGKHHRFHLIPHPLTAVRAALDKLTISWLHRLDALGHLLAAEQTATRRKTR